MEYAGNKVPVGTLFMVSPAVVHRLPEVFAAPVREDKRYHNERTGFAGGTAPDCGSWRPGPETPCLVCHRRRADVSVFR